MFKLVYYVYPCSVVFSYFLPLFTHVYLGLQQFTRARLSLFTNVY